MTDASSAFPIAVPANTAKTSPVTVQCPLGWSDVQSIMLVFPAGCSGFVGLSIRYAGNPVYPVGSNAFYVLDDYVLVIPVTNQQKAGQWQVVAYNTDFYAHTPTVYFSYNYLPQGQQGNSSTLVSL